MTCAEVREQFSARVDDALGTVERAALDDHLATCTECRREWERFAGTVGLLRAVEPARAPVGFVDRVLTAARPRPWYRRLARGLLVPWPVKLPLDAAAVVMVAGLAVLLFQRSPELQQAAQRPAPAAVSDAETTLRSAARTKAEPSDAAPAKPDAPASSETTTARLTHDALAPALTDRRDAPAPPSRSRQEPAPVAPASPPVEERIVGGREQAVQQAPQGAAAPRPAPAAERDTVSGFTAPAPERKPEDAEAQLKRLAARVPASVELSLAVADRDAAAAAVGDIVDRLGGAVVAGPSPGSLEIMVPRDAFPRLAGDLGRLGTLRIVRQPADLPPSVRIGLQLTD